MISFKKLSLQMLVVGMLFLLVTACGEEEPTLTAEPVVVERQGEAVLPTVTNSPEPLVQEFISSPPPEPTNTEAVGVAAATIEPTATPTTAPSPTIEASLTPTATLSPTLVPTPSPTSAPLAIPAPWPLAENAISLENVGQLVQVGRLGWGVVDRLRYSPDGSLLAVATNLGIFLHDAETGERVRVVDIPSPLVSFNFSPDGTLMASGHNDGRIRIWQVSDGGLVRTIENDSPGAVWSVAFSPDGEQIASAITNENGLIYLWQVSDGALVQTLSGHESRVRDVVFSPDGRYLASASIDWEVRVWDAADGSQHARLRGHDGPVWRVAFTPDSERLISAGSKGEVGLWQVENGSRIAIFTAQQPFIEVVALAVSPDGERFYTAAEDGYIRAWDVESRELVFELDFDRVVQELTVSPDGRTLAAYVGRSSVLLFDAETGERVEPTLPYSIEDGGGVAFSPNGSRLLIASFWSLKLWSTDADADPLVLNELSDGSFNNLQTVVYDPNGRYFATGSRNRAFWLWDAVNLGLVGYFPSDPPSTSLSQIISLAASGNGQRLAIGWGGSLVSTASVDDNLSVQTIYNIETAARVRAVALSQDGNQLFVGTDAGEVERWELPEGDDVPSLVALEPLVGQGDGILELALSPDGSVLAAVDAGGRVFLWSVEDGSLVAEIDGGGNVLLAVAFSPDGRLVAAAGVDQMVRIWRVSDGQLVRTLSGFQSSILSLAFSPDGAVLASGTSGAAVYLWGLAE